MWNYINMCAHDGMTPLSTAAATGSVGVLSALMCRLLCMSLPKEKKCVWFDKAVQNEKVNTALDWAAREGQIDAAELLCAFQTLVRS